MKNKKIVIAGTSTFTVKNLGDEAMLVNLVQSIRRYRNKTKIILICRHPSKKIDKLYNLKTIKNLEFDKKEDSINNFFYGFNSNKKSKNLEKIKDIFASSDELILAGNIFMELVPNTFLRGLASYGSTLGIIAKFFNLKIFLTALNVLSVPRDNLVKQYINFFSRICEKAVVREKNAYKNLVHTNFDKRKLFIKGDPAFGIEIEKNKISKEYLKYSFKEKTIGVCLRLEYWKYKNKKADSNFFKKHARILSILSKKTNTNLLFVPNGFYNYGWMDDRLVHNKIIKYLDKKVKYKVIKKELNVFEAAHLVSKVDFHYTNRRHSAVFAFIANKSAAVINTNLQGHLDPLVKDLNIKENLINFNFKSQIILKKLFLLWKNRIKTSKKIKPKVEKLKKSAKQQYKFLIS